MITSISCLDSPISPQRELVRGSAWLVRGWCFALCVLICISITTCPVFAEEYQFDFEASLPEGASLQRSTPAIGAGGILVPPNEPRFTMTAVAAGARLLAELPNERVLASREIDGVRYSIVRTDELQPALTSDMPGLDLDPVYLLPDDDVIDKLRPGSEWGQVTSAEILPDETVLLHTRASGTELRTATLRTTIRTFDDDDGIALVRESDYIPPEGCEATSIVSFFTRTTYLANLDVWVSAIAEYASTGLCSSTYPGDGRSLGYASTDSGRTWVRVIDTDDLLLGRELVDQAKHLHHLEPFEWKDPISGEWKIGAIGLLGDGIGAIGQIMAYADDDTYPNPDLGEYPQFSRFKIPGKHLLTDLFPLDNSNEGPGLLFVGGPDHAQGGMATLAFEDDAEVDTLGFSTTVNFFTVATGLSRLTRWPYVMQIDRLSNGAIVAPTVNFADPLTTPATNNIWVTSGSAQHWANAYLVNSKGYIGMLPVGDNLFWTSNRTSITDQLFELSSPLIRRSLLLGASAREVLGVPAFTNDDGVEVSEVTGIITGPSSLPPDVEIFRVRSDSLLRGQTFDAGMMQPLQAGHEQLVELVFWVKPVKDDLALATFYTGLDVELSNDDISVGSKNLIDLDLNDWQRIVVPITVPEEGVIGARPRFTMAADASSALPLDYWFTRPQVIVADQVVVQPYRNGVITAADQLRLTLPTLGTEWSVAVWGTEARSFVIALMSQKGNSAWIEPTALGMYPLDTGRQTALQFNIGLDADRSDVTTAPVVTKAEWSSSRNGHLIVKGGDAPTGAAVEIRNAANREVIGELIAHKSGKFRGRLPADAIPCAVQAGVDGVFGPQLTVDDSPDECLAEHTLSESELAPSAGGGIVGSTTSQDILYPTQNLVILTLSREANRLTAYIARGMGEIEVLQGPRGSGFRPRELRFGTPTWDRVYEGHLHRVKVWTDRALDLSEAEMVRISFVESE